MIEIRENIHLAPYTTLQVGGNAKYFAEPTSDDEVIEALRWAEAHAFPVFILGGGSNLLVSDAGFRGLVLHMTMNGIEARDHGAKRIYSAGAGVEWDTLVACTIKDNCAGLECLSGIPGTVGGTPVQNVGAYGQDVSETIVRVCAVDTATFQRAEFDKAACGFSYRQSRFNGSDLGRYILTRVDYALQPGGTPNISYSDIKRYFSNTPHHDTIPTLSETRKSVLTIRRGKGMVLDEDDADSRSAGSFFKNPVVSLAQYERIAAGSAVPVPHFVAGQGQVKLAAAWLVEQAGIEKGFILGQAAVSSKHTLALTNRGGATAADVLLLKEFVQRRVHERFGVELRPEPVMLGF
jgi:UDP-N-acetylmuramate dehydrogenase